MKSLNGKKKTAIGIVAAIVSAAVYLFGGVMGWWQTVIKPDEPAQKLDPKVEVVAKALPDAKPAVKKLTEEPIVKAEKKATKKAKTAKKAVEKATEVKK